jgi:large subunit ribosomal protein L17
MRKRKKGRKLSRETGQRRALLKSLVSALVLNEKIKISEARAKEISGLTEKFITMAKKEGLAARRNIASRLSDKIAKKLIENIAPRYKERKGGYTRIMKLGQRKTDGAKMAIIELIK